jgi:hypothetical protein
VFQRILALTTRLRPAQNAWRSKRGGVNCVRNLIDERAGQDR